MNLLSLIGATLLTVSPILNEPKNVNRPDNVIMEKVEYLDYNIIASSYIYEDGNSYVFNLNLNDGKDININYLIYSSLLNNEYLRDFELSFGSEDFVSSFLTGSDDELVSYGNLSQNYYEFDIRYNEGGLICDYYYEVYEDLEVSIDDVELIIGVSPDYLNYYQNEDVSLVYSLESNNLFSYYMSKYFFLKEASPITDNIFDVVGGTVQEYLNVVVDLFNEVIELFYVNNKLTILGVLMVFTFGVGIVKFGFNLIKDLLRL